MITSNLMTEPILGRLDIFTKESNPLLFNFASGKFSAQGQNATPFFTRVLARPVANIVFL